MRTQPKAFLILSVALLVVAFSYPAQIMMIYDHSPLEARAILEKLAPLNWVVMAGCIFVSLIAFQASSWTLALFPVLTVCVAWNNWVVGQAGTDFTAMQTSVATLGFASLGGLLFDREAWAAILRPDLRWWLRPERKQVEAPVFVIPSQGAAFRAHTFDISTSGAFIPISEEGPAIVREGDKLALRLNMGALTVLRCEALVVRRTDPRGHYPAGIGIEFLNMNREESKELKRYLRGLL